MVTIGNKESIFSRSFIIPNGEEARFHVPIGTPQLEIILRFQKADPDQKDPHTSWTLANNILPIVFKGWKNALNTALTKPAQLGMLGDIKFGFNVVISNLEDVHFVNFELYLGGGTTNACSRAKGPAW